MIDLQLIFILCAVIVVLVLARYLQMFFEELTKEKKIKILKQKSKKDKKKIMNNEQGAETVTDTSFKAFENSFLNESSSLDENLGSTLSFALLHILKNIVALEAQHKKLVDTGIFDKKLHSSNLISRVKIDYELINNDLRDIINQEAGASLAKDFQIMIEHVKYIDFTFQESGLVRDYVIDKSDLMDMRFVELRSLANLLFLKSLKLNSQIINHEEIKVFMKKYPAYFKIKV
jgi:predicted DNA-binding ArsR family transcriptional regulator